MKIGSKSLNLINMNNSLQEKKLKEFGFVFGTFLPLLFGWLIPSLKGHEFAFWTLFISLPFILLSIFSPKKLIYPYKIWMKIGHILGYINGNLILGLIFLVVVQPISLIMRLGGYDPLRSKFLKKKSSYRENKKNHQIDLTRIF